MTLIEKIKAWRNARNPAKITLERVKGFIQAYWRKFFPLIPFYITEQYNYRLTIVDKECLKEGNCFKDCGCAVPDKLWEDAKCLCYPEMLSKKEWKEFKKNGYKK